MLSKSLCLGALLLVGLMTTAGPALPATPDVTSAAQVDEESPAGTWWAGDGPNPPATSDPQQPVV